MMKLFPELRRPWSDGLVSALGIQDYRDPFEIQFGLFGDDDSGGSGSDTVDRSNPNEMAAREKAAARSGTVTSGDGSTVTSTNSDGSKSAVTAGSQAQQVAAREAFDATDTRASDTRSNYAQDQYDQVRAQEDAALQRAAAAGRLAGSDTGVDASAINSALANVGDVTQPYAADELAFTQGMSGGQPALTPEQQTARMMGEDPFARPELTVAQRAALTTDQNIDDQIARNRAAIAAMDLTPEEQAEREAIAARQRTFVTGITTTPQATAANVLGTTPSDMARIATADAAMDPSAVQVFDASPNAMDAGDMMLNPGLATGLGSLPTPGGTVRDLQAQRQAQQAAASTLGLSPGALGGRIAAPLPDMVDAETDMVARNLTDLNRPGYRDGLPIGLETYTRPDGVTLTTNLAGLTEEQIANQPFSMDVANFMGSQPYGYELDNQGNVIGQVGTPGMSLVGNAITGLQNMLMGPPEKVEDLLDRGAYTGMSLAGSDDGGSDGGQQATADPCPEGYQLVDGVCQPVDDVTADEPAAPGSNFVINPTTGLPTLFQPTTQATQVGQINPFVLQPYTPMQAQNIQQARSGIQALSPTGAALGRQV